MSVLTPSGRLEICQMRLSKSATDAAPVSLGDVLGFISDGHREIVERCGLLEQTATITVSAGTQEYGLPVDYYSLVGVYQAGVRLLPLPDRLSSTLTTSGFYYYRTGLIGLTPMPDADSSLLVHYQASPQDFDDWTDDPLFGAEWDYLLVEYAAWRIYLLGGDSGEVAYPASTRRRYISYADQRKSVYDRGLQELANRGKQIDRTTADRLQVVADQVPFAS